MKPNYLPKGKKPGRFPGAGSLGLRAAAQAVDLAALTFRGASSPRVANNRRGSLDARRGWGSEILEVLCRLSCAAAPRS